MTKMPDEIWVSELTSNWWGHEPSESIKAVKYIRALTQADQPADIDRLMPHPNDPLKRFQYVGDNQNGVQIWEGRLTRPEMDQLREQPADKDDRREALAFCEMVEEIGMPDDTVIPVWPIDTEMAVTHPLTVGMVKTMCRALSGSDGRE